MTVYFNIYCFTVDFIASSDMKQEVNIVPVLSGCSFQLFTINIPHYRLNITYFDVTLVNDEMQKLFFIAVACVKTW